MTTPNPKIDATDDLQDRNYTNVVIEEAREIVAASKMAVAYSRNTIRLAKNPSARSHSERMK